MIKVQVDLYTMDELAIITEAVRVIDEKRNKLFDDTHESTAPTETRFERNVREALAEADLSPIAETGPAPIPERIETKKVSQADIENNLRAYAEKNGLDGARKLLDKVGISQLGKATPEQLAALAAELGT